MDLIPGIYSKILHSDGAALDDVKKDYKEILSNIGLSENEFRDSVEYFAKKEGKSIIDQALKNINYKNLVIMTILKQRY